MEPSAATAPLRRRAVTHGGSSTGTRAHCIVIIRCYATCTETTVRTTLALDDNLVAEAQRLTGTTEKTALVRQALRALIERESARRLAQLAGSEPDAKSVPRRQSMPA